MKAIRRFLESLWDHFLEDSWLQDSQGSYLLNYICDSPPADADLHGVVYV